MDFSRKCDEPSMFGAQAMTITDEMVERAAKACYEAEYDRTDYPWDAMPKEERLSYRVMARAALEAVLSGKEER